MKNIKMWMLVTAVLVLLLNIVSVVSATEKPDLIIESFSAPASATQTEMISQKIKVTVKNVGGSEAKDFTVAIILKGTVLRSDFPTAYHVLGSGQVAGLKPEQSAHVALQNFSTGTIVPPKQYEICAIADEGKKVNESDENNNWSKCQFINITP